MNKEKLIQNDKLLEKYLKIFINKLIMQNPFLLNCQTDLCNWPWMLLSFVQLYKKFPLKPKTFLKNGIDFKGNLFDTRLLGYEECMNKISKYRKKKITLFTLNLLRRELTKSMLLKLTKEVKFIESLKNSLHQEKNSTFEEVKDNIEKTLFKFNDIGQILKLEASSDVLKVSITKNQDLNKSNLKNFNLLYVFDD